MDRQHPPHDTMKYQVFDLSKPVPAERLLGGQAAIRIVHNGQVYHLSLTRNDKLILTK
jgi:hemin uptake protein HemP